MKKITTFVLAFGAAVTLIPLAHSDEIEFTTLPQPVQTTVIRETHIQNPSAVTHVVRSGDGIYSITVRDTSGDRVVYVNPEGAIVQAPANSTTTTTVQQPGEEQVIAYGQIQDNMQRYQLVKKEGRKEVYLDRQTGKKVKVERED
jgi:hypothetical protein